MPLRKSTEKGDKLSGIDTKGTQHPGGLGLSSLNTTSDFYSPLSPAHPFICPAPALATICPHRAASWPPEGRWTEQVS